MSSQQMFAPPVSAWAVNDDELRRLREQLAEAHRAVERESDWVQRARLQAVVNDLTRRLGAAEVDRTAVRRQDAMAERRRTDVTRATNVAHAIRDGRCLSPVPYWQSAHPPRAAEADTANWSDLRWSEQSARITEAMQELRRIRAAG